MIRVVVDPSVFVSALLGRRGGAPDLVVRALVDDRIEVLVSPLLLAELEGVLQRPKFSRASADERRAFVDRVRLHATAVADPVDQPVATRDRNDDYLVALGRHEQVDAIVTVDRDLLDAEIETPAAWTPRKLVDRLAKSRE